jgi:hypothetical protein
MKIPVPLIALLAVGAVAGCSPSGRKIETSEQRLGRWRGEATACAWRDCTNMVIGFTKVVRVSVDDRQPKVSEWRADVEVEHVNVIGGIERTNLPLLFRIGLTGADDLTHVYADFDERRYWDGRLGGSR